MLLINKVGLRMFDHHWCIIVFVHKITLVEWIFRSVILIVRCLILSLQQKITELLIVVSNNSLSTQKFCLNTFFLPRKTYEFVSLQMKTRLESGKFLCLHSNFENCSGPYFQFPRNLILVKTNWLRRNILAWYGTFSCESFNLF